MKSNLMISYQFFEGSRAASLVVGRCGGGFSAQLYYGAARYVATFAADECMASGSVIRLGQNVLTPTEIRLDALMSGLNVHMHCKINSISPYSMPLGVLAAIGGGMKVDAPSVTAVFHGCIALGRDCFDETRCVVSVVRLSGKSFYRCGILLSAAGDDFVSFVTLGKNRLFGLPWDCCAASTSFGQSTVRLGAFARTENFQESGALTFDIVRGGTVMRYRVETGHETVDECGVRRSVTATTDVYYVRGGRTAAVKKSVPTVLTIFGAERVKPDVKSEEDEKEQAKKAESIAT